MSGTLIQLVNMDEPGAGGPYFTVDNEQVPVVGDMIDHPAIRGAVNQRCHKYQGDKLHYIRIHVDTEVR